MDASDWIAPAGLVTAAVGTITALHGLMHDAAEAYTAPTEHLPDQVWKVRPAQDADGAS